MKSGTVKLIGSRGGVIRQEKYNTPTGREQIIGRWKKRYSTKQYLTIHICPDEGKEEIREVNTRKYHFIQDADKKPIVRPPAIYSNQRSLYP